MHTFRSLVFFAFLSTTLAAQPMRSKSSGPFARSRHGLSVDGATCALDRAEIYHRRVGAAPLLPEVWPGRAPDYRIASIVGAAVAAVIDVDAMSVGHDTIHADPLGVLIPPLPPGWAAMTFSVTRATAGAFGPVRAEAATADGAAGDLFSWHVRAGRAGLAERVYLAQDSIDLLTNCGGRVGDIDAHDLHMAAAASAAAIQTLYPMPAVFYFSITSATAAAAPASWWGPDGASGATILQTTWTGAAWTPITPLYTWRQLGLVQGDDIDALAAMPQVPLRPYGNWILFSTASGLPDPIMIYSPLPVVGPTPYMVQGTTGTVTVSSRLGLGGGDDVDAICVLDPGDSSHPFDGLQSGSPFDEIYPWPFTPTGNVSGCAAREAAGLRLYVQGCPPLGCGSGSLAVLLLGFPGNPAAVTLFGVRPPSYDALEHLLAVDPTTLWGVAIEARWLLADPSFSSLDATVPLRVRL
ncbi:MAG: hypothetical protein R3F56_23300 [Planctomycetota bacterium]